MPQDDRYLQAKKVTLIGAVVNAFLGFVKVIGGYFYHSHALVADGFHSFSDLITDIMVLLASKFGSQDADENHPYGHQRIETAATLMLSLLLILAGIGIAWDAVDAMLHTSNSKPQSLSLLVVGLSILANELLYHYTQHIGKKINSQLIIANAWHHRSDAASSLVVLVGIVGSLLGYHYLDSLAAVVVGIMIVKMGWDYGWNSVKELVDTAVDAEQLQEIQQIIEKIQGIQKIHQLRSRLMAGDIYIDVHIIVSPKITVSEGHYIAQQVHHSLVRQIKSVKDVTVHVDPEDDEICSPSMHLGTRKQLHEEFLEKICQKFAGIICWNIHYLNGKISIDVLCDKDFTQSQALNEALNQAIVSRKDIKEIRVFCMNDKALAQNTLAN